ncbi:MAG: hypothetical protein MUO63_18365 [Desulfobulbaceae bacterium]|nr:hypothetical protein [Desulfobulbaceae bacterium]
MKVFLIHRFASRKDATGLLKSIASKGNITLHPVVLDSSGCDDWKSTALSSINDCEAVAVFDLPSCMKSENAEWEINQAKDLGKPLILLDPKNLDECEISKLYCLYHYDEEFNSYFQKDGKDTETLYKMMVDSSEQLIQRRQRMNAFFITAIGSLLAIASTLAKFGTVKNPTISFLIVAVFGIIGLFLCSSWRNLIDNYGKLNAAKFRVILKLEQNLSAQIFSAEWAALGKGLRPQKYQSFTSTENLVPLWFAILIFTLIVFAISWRIWG